MSDDVKIILFWCVVIFVVFVFLFLGIPVWNMWRAELSGRGELARAESIKRIMIETARAEKESAQLRADAILIMGKAAKEYPEYRDQEFIQAFGEALREGKIQQIIYVPTEANIPVLEAGKR